jgi:hypothetical protein
MFTATLDSFALSNDLAWQERGPNNVGGRTRALLVDPNDPTGETVWAGSVSGGLWVTRGISSVGLPGLPAPDFSWSAVPNPFRDRVQLLLNWDQPGAAQISIYDLSGREVKRLFAGVHAAGRQQLVWHPEAGLPAGVYLAVAEAHGRRQVLKLMHQP